MRKQDIREIKSLTFDEELSMCKKMCKKMVKGYFISGPIRLYPIPRGGIPVAYLAKSILQDMKIKVEIVNEIEVADFIVDDLIDTGYTRNWYAEHYPQIPFHTLLENQPYWIEFTWEQTNYLHKPLETA